MPLIAVAAQNLMLDRMWASQPGTLMQLGLLTGDPRTGGVELSSEGGYARATVGTYATFWQPAVDGKKTSTLVAFPDTSAAWPVAGSWEGIFIDGELWDAGPLAVPVVVTGAGPGASMRISRHFNTEL